MKDLNNKALGGLLSLIIILVTSLFLPARTLNYWQAWIFLAVFSVSVLAITIYLMKKDPKLLERRVKAGPGAEKQKLQNVIQFLASIAFIAIFVFSALDHRLGWSKVPVCVVALEDALVLLGLLIVFFVFKVNTFSSGIIEVKSEQKLISTGPYAFVHHPMYMGAFIMLLGAPVALGSWWGLFTFIPLSLVIVWRLLDEEKFLAKNLSGYSEYQKKVRYRLVPFIW